MLLISDPPRVRTLPSANTLRKYKNCLNQRPGFNPDVLMWMRQEMDRLTLKPNKREGALVLDEMSVQEDLSVVHKGAQSFYSGQVRITEYCEALMQQRKGVLNILFKSSMSLSLFHYSKYASWQYPFYMYHDKLGCHGISVHFKLL